MSDLSCNLLSKIQPACTSLLHELQKIWDEIGETDEERDKILLQLEQECLDVYQRKINEATTSKAKLQQAIDDLEAEHIAISSVTDEPLVPLQPFKNARSLKEELRSIIPQLEEMRRRKTNRQNQFLDVLDKIGEISMEIGYTKHTSSITMDENNLSMKKLEEFHKHLQDLQKEKSDRCNQVLDRLGDLKSLCLVLGMDFNQAIGDLHSSLNEHEEQIDISNSTMKHLDRTMKRLRKSKLQRMQKLQDLASALLVLWNLMDTPLEEQQLFHSVTCKIASSEEEITEPNMLSEAMINNVVEEVFRLEELKASKMMDLVLMKKTQLEKICRQSHIVPEFNDEMQFSMEHNETGSIDPPLLLEQMEAQIAKVKEEAFSRKEILEKVEKWMGACDEESWLDEYNKDGNRFSAGKGAHFILKRAEKARIIVSKLPSMVEALATKTVAWEKEQGTKFTFDGVDLLSILEEYTNVRQEKEQERKRQRDQKRLQGQPMAEHEAIPGVKFTFVKPRTLRRASTGIPMGGGGGGGGALVHNTSGKRLLVRGGDVPLQPPKQETIL